MTVYAFISLIGAVAVAFFGCFVFFRNPRSRLNRLFFYLCLSISYWSFSEYGLRTAETAERAAFFITLGAAWPLSIVLLLHFMMVFTERASWLRHPAFYAVLYLPAAGFVLMDVWLSRTPLRAWWGWTDSLFNRPWDSAFLRVALAWGMVIALAVLVMGYRYLRAAASPQGSKASKYVLIGASFPVVVGIVTEAILPLFHIRVPEVTSSSATVMCVFIAYAIWKHELFALNPATAAETIISTMSDALFLVDSQHIVQSVNNAALGLLGYERHELIGHPVSKVLPKDAQSTDTRQERFQNMLNNGAVNDVEVKLQTRDGRDVPVSLSWSTTRSSTGETLGITFIGRDISERIKFQESLQKSKDELESKVGEQTKELKVSNSMLRQEIAERLAAEEKLAAEKEYLAVTLRSIGDGVITAGRDGLIALMNKVAEDLTGWAAEEGAGKRLSEVFRIFDEKSRERWPEDPVESVFGSGAVLTLGPSILLVSKTGVERSISASAAPITDKAGKIRGIVLVFRDISDRRKLEEELFRTRKLESIAVLADGFAHDFNNILTGIMTNLFVARMHVSSDSETHEILSETEKAAFRASSLTKQLLAFSKGVSPIKERTQLRPIIEEAAGFCLGDSNVDYELDIAADLCEVEVDRGLMDQALTHIITNAAEAMPSGGSVTIGARNVTIDSTKSGLPLKRGNYTAVTVTDHGPGIHSSILHRIFDPYFTTKANRNGLGLTTAYSIVRKHDGCVDVLSEEGKGSTFTIYIPACEAPEKRETAPSKTPSSVPKGRILLMDDEEYILKSTGKLLNILGYETAVARDGAEAVKLYQEASEQRRPFDVVILDLAVPGGIGGREALDRLAQIEPGVKAILSSAYPDDPIMNNYRVYGFRGAIAKPYEIEELSDLVRGIIGEGR